MKNKKEKDSYNHYINLLIDKVFNCLKDFAKAINSEKCDDIIKVILKIIFALIIVSLLKIPFNLLTGFFHNIFKLLPYTYSIIFSNFFNILMEIIYIVISIVLLVIFIKNISVYNEVLDLDKKKIIEPIVLVLKIFLMILLIPLVILSIILLLILTLIIISTIFNIYLTGFYLIIISFIIINVTSIMMIIKSLNRGDE